MAALCSTLLAEVMHPLHAVSMPPPDVADLRVADLLTFLSVVRSSSLTAAARERRVTPSQVSKAITRLENHFGRKLVERGSRGVLLSEAGRVLAPSLEAIVSQLEAARTANADTTEIMLGAPSYLQAALIPVIASAAPNLRVRSFGLPSPLLRANAREEGFTVLILPGGEEYMPATWLIEPVGEVRKGLFASPTLARKLGYDGKPLDPSQLLETPFVCPVFRQKGQGIPLDDDCPLPRHRRLVGHEVQTIFVALEIAVQTEQLAFGPVVSAERHLRSGALIELQVAGWDARERLSIACDIDRIPARLRTSLTRALREALASAAT